MRALTYALTQEVTARAALDALAGSVEPAAVEALVEVLARPHQAGLTPAAVAALAGIDGPLADQALLEALDSPLAPVRQGAAETLTRRKLARAHDDLRLLLAGDDSWPVRRAALAALAGLGSWAVLVAADDPHWRVRHALVNALLDWGRDGPARAEIDWRLAGLPVHPRVEGIRAYLGARWPGTLRLPPVEQAASLFVAAELAGSLFYDPDPNVLVRLLEELGEDGRCRYLDAMPALLSHEAPRARSLARQALARRGEAAHLAAAVARLDDPREGAGDTVSGLLASLDLDRVEETARLILHTADPSPAQLAWAVDQLEQAFPAGEEVERLTGLFLSRSSHPPRVRKALARLAGRWPAAAGFLPGLLADPDPGVQREALHTRGMASDEHIRPLLSSPSPRVRAAAVCCLNDSRGLEALARDEDARVRIALAGRLGSLLENDPHPQVRAAALTPARAAELLAHPERETSWLVLHAAAALMRTPAWHLEPRPPWQPPTPVITPLASLDIQPGTSPHGRFLGPARLRVPPIGLSGHYGLPVEGFTRAVEHGLDFLFWEPNYQTLTAFATRVSPSTRRGLYFLTGTFEATPQRLRNDVEKALRALRVEQLALFLVFWVRGWRRLTDEMRRMLERLRQAGQVGQFSLSTHDRALAVEAIEAGWDPIMVRHSAAHRGAETAVLPHAAARGTRVITFNNTCYGRLLRPPGALSAADCYRYSLAQPGVTMCLSAPANLRQLEETLQVAESPDLPPDRLAEVIAHGAEVYREEALFRQTIRGR